MTVEIRELIIKTEIKSSPEASTRPSAAELKALKQEIIVHCKRALKNNARNGRYNR